MALLPKEGLQFHCRGCGKIFATFNAMNPHKRKGTECAGVGWDIVVPDSVKRSLDGNPENEAADERMLDNGTRPEADGRLEPEEKPGTSADGQANGGSAFGGGPNKAPPRGATFLDASYTKETLTPTVETLSMFDFWRQRLGCEELSFNEWVQQCLDDYHWIIGLEVAVVIRPRRHLEEAHA